MTLVATLLTWANAPFTVALGVAVSFVTLQLTGVLGALAGGDDGDHDGDADDALDGDADGDAESEHGESHTAMQTESHEGLLVAVGVGKVPLSILWQTFAGAFGLTGIIANAVYLEVTGALPPLTLLWTMPLSVVTGYVATRGVGRALSRVVSGALQDATSRKELVGQTGVVISSSVTQAFGEIRIKDKTGHTLRVICQVRPGDAPIAEGAEVVVVDFEEGEQKLFVAPLGVDGGALTSRKERTGNVLAPPETQHTRKD